MTQPLLNIPQVQRLTGEVAEACARAIDHPTEQQGSVGEHLASLQKLVQTSGDLARTQTEIKQLNDRIEALQIYAAAVDGYNTQLIEALRASSPRSRLDSIRAALTLSKELERKRPKAF